MTLEELLRCVNSENLKKKYKPYEPITKSSTDPIDCTSTSRTFLGDNGVKTNELGKEHPEALEPFRPRKRKKREGTER